MVHLMFAMLLHGRIKGKASHLMTTNLRNVIADQQQNILKVCHHRYAGTLAFVFIIRVCRQMSLNSQFNAEL